MTERIFRIWMDMSRRGVSHYEFYADVIESHYMKALAAARKGKVGNWKFDCCWGSPRKNKRDIGYVGIINPEEAENPQRPLEKMLENWEWKEPTEKPKGHYVRVKID